MELTRIAKSELEKLSETREKQIVELERKLSQIESENQRLADKGKLQRTESDWMLQKEKQIKQVSGTGRRRRKNRRITCARLITVTYKRTSTHTRSHTGKDTDTHTGKDTDTHTLAKTLTHTHWQRH